MSYNMRHALNTMFCLLSVSCLVGELYCLHTTVMLTVCYINRQPGRGHHYSKTNACGESAASKNSLIREGCLIARNCERDIQKMVHTCLEKVSLAFQK